MKRVTIAITAALSLLVLAGVLYFMTSNGRVSSATGESQPIRIAFNTWIGYSAFYIAEEEGLFAKRRIEVETAVIEALAEKNAAILRGEIDGMGGTIDSAVISVASGVDGSLIFQFDHSSGADGILASAEVQSVQDLVGRSVAVEEGFIGHFFLLYVLDKEGIPRESVKIVPMGTEQAGEAFASGNVDVAVIWEPYLSTAERRPGAHVLVSSADIEPILAATLFMSRRFLDERSNDAVALVEALQEANDLWLAHPEKYNPLVAKRWGLSLEDLTDIMDAIEIVSAKDQLSQFGSSASPGPLLSYLSKCAALWLEAGVIERAVEAKKVVDPGPVSAALAAGQ